MYGILKENLHVGETLAVSLFSFYSYLLTLYKETPWTRLTKNRQKIILNLRLH